MTRSPSQRDRRGRRDSHGPTRGGFQACHCGRVTAILLAQAPSPGPGPAGGPDGHGRIRVTGKFKPARRSPGRPGPAADAPRRPLNSNLRSVIHFAMLCSEILFSYNSKCNNLSSTLRVTVDRARLAGGPGRCHRGRETGGATVTRDSGRCGDSEVQAQAWPSHAARPGRPAPAGAGPP